MFSIPNTIHFIWLGGFLQQKHQDRIKKWQRLNPEYTVCLWVNKNILSEAETERFLNFCQTNKITLHDTIELYSNMDVEVGLWLNYCLTLHPRNYGVLSDVYRFYILNQFGGWYFDTDIEPKLPLPTHIKLAYGFAINGASTYRSDLYSYVYEYFRPDIIVGCKNNIFLQQAINILQKMVASPVITKFSQYIHSQDALTRMLTTHLITGGLALAACSRLTTYYYMPLVHLYDEYTGLIEDNESFRSITLSACFKQSPDNFLSCFNEVSWLKDEDSNFIKQLENENRCQTFIANQNNADFSGIPEEAAFIQSNFSEIIRSVKAVSLEYYAFRKAKISFFKSDSQLLEDENEIVISELSF